MRGGWSAESLERVTVSEWGKRWMATMEPHLKRTTIAAYASLLRLEVMPTFGGQMVRDVRPIAVAQWLADMTAGKSASWTRKAYRLFSQMMASAVDNDLITVTPCRGHRLPRLPEPEPRILTVEQVERLAECSAGPAALIVRVLAYSGMRIGEALSLRRDDVSADARVLRVDERQAEIDGHLDYDVPKNHQKRPVALPAFVAESVASHVAAHVGREPDSLLWTGRTGQALRYGSWRRWQWLPAVAAAGLDGLTPHDLRATHGTWVADSHGVMAAAERLGHSNANVLTRHYARAVDGRDGEIAVWLEAQHRDRLVARGLHGDSGCRGDEAAGASQ
jgi:integrase